LPPGVVSHWRPNWTFPAGNCNAEPAELGPGWSVLALILPYMEQDNLYQTIRLDLPIADPAIHSRGALLYELRVPSRQAFQHAFNHRHIFDCGNPPAADSIPRALLTDVGQCSYVGCLGGGMPPTPIRTTAATVSAA